MNDRADAPHRYAGRVWLRDMIPTHARASLDGRRHRVHERRRLAGASHPRSVSGYPRSRWPIWWPVAPLAHSNERQRYPHSYRSFPDGSRDKVCARKDSAVNLQRVIRLRGWRMNSIASTETRQVRHDAALAPLRMLRRSNDAAAQSGLLPRGRAVPHCAPRHFVTALSPLNERPSKGASGGIGNSR